jgi:hypothetical protein
LKRIPSRFAVKQSLDAPPLFNLVCVLIKNAWSEPIAVLQAPIVTQRILDRLGKREDGPQLIRDLRRNLDALFGLHVTATANAGQMTENWLAANNAGLPIIGRAPLR